MCKCVFMYVTLTELMILGMLKIIKSVVATPVFSIIRPRGGDFLYDDHEFAVMQENVKALKEAGSDGFVFGILCKYSIFSVISMISQSWLCLQGWFC